MNTGPQLHRSLTLWAGLFFILFTCWAWRDSSRNLSLLRWKQINVASITRGFMIARYTGAEWPHPVTERTPATSYFTNLHQEFLPAPFLVQHGIPNFFTRTVGNPTLKQTQQATTNATGIGSWCLFIPYWLILLLIILTWTSLLFLRTRRRKRAIAHTLSEGAS